MPAAQPQTRSQKDRIIANLPVGTSRVQVITEKGKTAWREPAMVGIKEQIVLKAGGQPITMKGQPGRKKKVELVAVSDNVAEIQEAKDQAFEENELLTAIMEDPESDVAINLVLRGMAEEIASLEFERREAERNGLDTSNISMRRARVLKALGDTLLRRREKLSSTSLDLESKGFETVFTFIMETYRLSLEDCNLRPEQIETVFTKFAKRIASNWKEEAKARMRTLA
jgi:hypothetical protein